MRKLPWPESEGDSNPDELEPLQTCEVLDWKQLSEEALEAFDRQLEEHDLEVVQYEYDGDCYVWKIEKRLPAEDPGLTDLLDAVLPIDKPI